MLQIFLAFIGGVLTIAAPCIILPLPIILGASANQTNKYRPLFITIGFVGTFAILAFSINFLVRSTGLDPNLLRNIAAILLAIFSLFMIWPILFEKISLYFSGFITRANNEAVHASKGAWGGLLVGAIIGIVWAPCAGPILASILTLILQEQMLSKAALLLLSYSIGAGVPMLAIAYGGQAITTEVRAIAKYSTALQRIFGIIILLLAIAIYFNYDTILQAKIVEKLPTFNSNIENEILHELDNSKKQNTKTNETSLQNYGKAPEFVGIEKWLNSDPLTMASLKGKVVLIDFWTYSCVNCIRTLPYVTKWYDTYKDQGFVIIGVHTPEFAFEKETSNVQAAIKRHKINYPVAQDNDFKTWSAWSNQYWPAHYLIDQNGEVRYYHFGEGKYEETENAIRSLLSMNKVKVSEPEPKGEIQSPEMYFGLSRLKNLTKEQTSLTKTENLYTLPKEQSLNTFALQGSWKFYPEYAVLAEGSEGSGTIRLKFSAGKVFMVAGSSEKMTVKIIVDGIEQASIQVKDKDLYQLFDSDQYKEHTIDILIPSQANFEAYTFTFG